MFDIKQYWKNRKDGKRGQGDLPIVVVPRPDLSKPPTSRPRGVPRNRKAKEPVVSSRVHGETNHERVTRQRTKLKEIK